MNKTIWICWFQGEDHDSLGPLAKKCISRWKELNPEWTMNVLSDETISDYVPEYFDIIKNSPRRRNAAKSDLLRILLLSKFGGVWADASVYPLLPLSDFYKKIVNNTGFFSYRFLPRSLSRKKGDREIASWFMCVNKPNHYIIEKWKTRFVTEFKKSEHWKYFTFHQTLTDLYDEDEQVKHIVDNMVQISEKIPHSALNGWDNKQPSYVYKRPRIADREVL